MGELESPIEKYLVSTIVSLGGACYKLAVPGKRGYPDQLCKLPGGSAFVVECKRPKGGRVAALQKVRHQEMRAVGWRVYLCKDREEIDHVIELESQKGSVL
jgi:hypothetical protein